MAINKCIAPAPPPPPQKRCPEGKILVNGVCVDNTGEPNPPCPDGKILVNGECVDVPDPQPEFQEIAQPVVLPQVPFPESVFFGQDALPVGSDISLPPNTPRYSSASRVVTVVPDNAFIIGDNWSSVEEDCFFVNGANPYNNFERATKPFRGSMFFKGNGTVSSRNITPDMNIDLLRWTLGSVWRSDSVSEYFFLQSTGPSNDVYNFVSSFARSSNLLASNIPISDDLGNLALPWHKCVLFGLQGESPEAQEVGDPRDALGGIQVGGGVDPFAAGAPQAARGGAVQNNYTISGLDETYRGDRLFEEKFRFTLKYGEQFLTQQNLHTLGVKFRKKFYYSKVMMDLDKYLDLFLLGSRSQYYNNLRFVTAQGSSSLVRDLFDMNSIPIVDLEKPRDKAYLDYTFDAPAAFLESETDNVLVSPSHTAKITSRFGSSDLLNIAGYTKEKQIPNLYRMYSYIDLEKKYENSSKAQRNPAQDYAWNVASKHLGEWRNPEIDPEDETFSDGIIKFPSDRVAKFEEINEFMEQYAPNVVRINIKTTQGGSINELLQRHKMDRLLLETYASATTKSENEKLLEDLGNPESLSGAEMIQMYNFALASTGKDVFENQTFILDDNFVNTNRQNFPNLRENNEQEEEKPDANSGPYAMAPVNNAAELLEEAAAVDGGVGLEEAIGPAIVIPGVQATTRNDKTESGITKKIHIGFFDILKNILPKADDHRAQIVNMDHYPLFYSGWDNIVLLRFEEAIKSQIFLVEAENIIKKNNLRRTYADILSGKKAYSEVIGYHVYKYRIEKDPNTGQDRKRLIQSFVFMDNNDIDDITYLDSQVLPFMKYRYEIHTINFVVGTRYRHTGLEQSVPNFDLTVESRKEICFTEAPFYAQDVIVRDMPPLPPQVTWSPYQGLDDKIGILLTTNYGEVTEQRISLYNGGPVFLQNGEPYMYTAKTDTLPTHFQVLRVEEAPKKWTDFASSPTLKHSFVKANSNAGFVSHDIEPNKYYYYIFRAIDNFQNEEYIQNKTMFSNPSDIFRVRMVSYENGIFLEMEPYEMEENKEKPPFEINFERFLKIKPNFKQTLINFSRTFKRLQPTVTLPVNGLNEMRKRFKLIDPNNPLYIADTKEFQNSAPPVEELALGAPDFPPHERLWSKRFKIRIKSKNSGRAIDLNVKFVENQQTLLKDESE